MKTKSKQKTGKQEPLRGSSKHQQQQQLQQQDYDYRRRDEIIIPLLAQRSFHLPGNTPKQDWIQWMRNNHIIFGTCFHHPLHPIETWERMIVLLGSISFAMVATNIGYIWDWYWYYGDEQRFDPGAVLYSWNMTSINGDTINDDESYGPSSSTTVEITYGTLFLWTFGCIFHSLFDYLVWNLSACACFHPGGRFGQTNVANRCNDLGSIILIPFVLSLLGLAGYSSYLRVTSGNSSLEDEYGDDLVDNLTAGKLGDYSFLVRFGIELILAWFVYFPLLSTVFFSGILGCGGKLPLLGGRPRDKIMVEKDLKETIIVESTPDPHTCYAEI